MSKKLYYAVMMPMGIIGVLIVHYIPSSFMYVLLALVLFTSYASWKDFREKFAKAEGEEEIRHAIIPLILNLIMASLFIILLIF